MPCRKYNKDKTPKKLNKIEPQPTEAAEIICLPHVVKVREDERLVDIEATGNDVFGVLHGKAVALFYCQILPQVFFIVGQLNHQRHVKYVLQPPVREK